MLHATRDNGGGGGGGVPKPLYCVKVCIAREFQTGEFLQPTMKCSIQILSPTSQVDIFSYGVMMVHMLSGQWPFPGEAVRVNPRNPNNPNDLVGVTEFDRHEEYINLIGNEHPLMTLIRQCLSNSPSHRPTSSEVHQRVSVVAADHPPSFTDRVEMMERIKILGEEKERVRSEREIIGSELMKGYRPRLGNCNPLLIGITNFI